MTSVVAMKKEIENTSNLNELVASCLEEFGEEIFNKWFADLEPVVDSNSEIILSTSSKFVRDWVIREFIESKKLLKLFQKLRPSLKKVAVIYNPNEAIATRNEEDSSNSNERKVTNLSKNDNVFAFGTELNPRFTFENFVSAKYNKLAVSMAKIAAGIDAQIDLFDDKIPLFIHGGVGTGKTHLAQAIAWKIKEFNKDKKVVYLSAEKFMYHFVQSVRNNDAMDFKTKMRSVDVLIVDDVQFIAGKASTQQEFMHSFNSLVEDNKQVILVCDRCPSDLENIDEKLKSRITGGMIVNFKNPDYQDRFSILKTKTKMMEQEICEKILSYIAEKVTTTVRDLEGALKKLAANKLLLDEDFTLEGAKTILQDYVKSSKSNAVNIEKIQKIVADFYDIKIADLSANNRSKSVSRPRQIAMYLAKNLTLESFPKIGAAFGGKNHATVMHSVKLIQGLLDTDSNLMQEIKTLEEKLS